MVNQNKEEEKVKNGNVRKMEWFLILPIRHLENWGPSPHLPQAVSTFMMCLYYPL